MCSEKTLYNYVDAQLFDIRNIDLPRKVKYRPRYKQPEFKVDRGCRIGRNYSDFQKFLESNPSLLLYRWTVLSDVWEANVCLPYISLKPV